MRNIDDIIRKNTSMKKNLKDYIKSHPSSTIEVDVLVDEFDIDLGSNFNFKSKCSEIKDLEYFTEKKVLETYDKENIRSFIIVYVEIDGRVWNFQQCLLDLL